MENEHKDRDRFLRRAADIICDNELRALNQEKQPANVISPMFGATKRRRRRFFSPDAPQFTKLDFIEERAKIRTIK